MSAPAAQMAFAYNPSLLDVNGNPRVVMEVIPDADSQLADKSFNPYGCIQLRLSISQYRQFTSTDMIQALIPGYVVPQQSIGQGLPA